MMLGSKRLTVMLIVGVARHQVGDTTSWGVITAALHEQTLNYHDDDDISHLKKRSFQHGQVIETKDQCMGQ